MKILGIDFSLNGTGLSIFQNNSLIFKKVFTTIKKNYQQNNEVFILLPKFNRMEDKLDWVCENIINCTDYDFVCMEDHLGSYYDWMDGYAIIKHYLRKNKTPYITVGPTQLKRYAGTGKADKDKMTELLKAEYNVDVDYIGPLANNIVDATWLSILGINYYDRYILNKDINLNIERSKILTKINEKFGEDT